MTDGEIVQEYPNGCVKKFTTDDGMTFEAYIPNGYDEDTNVIMYEHGDGGYYNDWRTYTAKFETGECDSIIIRADRRNSMNLYNHLVNTYNLNDENRMTVSFSGGTSYALYETVDMIKQNPGVNPPVSVLLDGYIASDYMISNGTSEVLKEGNAVLLAFGRSGGAQYFSQYLRFAKNSGVNMVIFKDTSEYGVSHSGVNKSFMEGGLLEYVEGRGELPDRYEIQIFDPEVGDFVTLDRSQVATLEDVYDLFGLEYPGSTQEYKYTLEELSKLEDFELRSEDKALEQYLNSIRSAIRSSSVSALNCGGFASSTMMPSQVPAVINRYLQSTTNFLSKLANETAQFAKIGESIKEMDFNLDRVARQIDDIDIVQTIYAGDTFNKEESISPSTTETPVNLDEFNSQIGIQPSDSTDSNTNTNTNTNTVPNTQDTSYQNTWPGVSPSYPHTGGTSSNVGGSDKTDKVVEDIELNDDFPEYKDLITNNNKLVFESEEGYKVVIHKDDDSIVGFEHYYDFNTESEAAAAMEKIKELYQDNEYFDGIIQSGRYIKVLFKSDAYKEWTMTGVEDLYKDVDGFIKV